MKASIVTTIGIASAALFATLPVSAQESAQSGLAPIFQVNVTESTIRLSIINIGRGQRKSISGARF
jgi:hypothetical protein